MAQLCFHVVLIEVAHIQPQIGGPNNERILGKTHLTFELCSYLLARWEFQGQKVHHGVE